MRDLHGRSPAGPWSDSDIQQLLSRVQPLIEFVQQRGAPVRPEDGGPVVINDVLTAAHVLSTLFAQARHSVNVLLPAEREGLPLLTAALQARTPRLAEGVALRVIAAPGGGAEARLRELRARRPGAEIRLARGVQHGLVLIDREAALLRTAGPGQAAETSLIRGPGVIRSLHSMVATAWRHAVPLAVYQRLAELLRKDRGAQVLKLMCAGYTDEAAARELALSVRTYRRRVAEFMHALGARSRFQAGLLAPDPDLLSLAAD